MNNNCYESLYFSGAKCSLKKSIEKNTTGIFESYCYNEICLPTFDGADNSDIAIPLAKAFATELIDCILPERVFCLGNTFSEKSILGRDVGEISLAGVGIAGESNPKADAEVISVMINSLLGIGMTEFTIGISNAGFLHGLANDLGVDEAELKSLIAENNAEKIKAFANKNGADSEVEAFILSIPTLFGDLNIYDEINMDILGTEAENALANIKRIYKLLCDYDLEKYISVDLSIADFPEYYTGMVFKGTVNKTENFVVCSGGRCDNLCKNYGRNIKMVAGFLETSKITELVYSDSDTDSKLIPLALVASDIPQLAYKVSFGLRAQGLKVEDFVSGASMIEAIEYGEEKGITIVIWVNEETAIMRNLKTGEMSETSLDKLLNV